MVDGELFAASECYPSGSDKFEVCTSKSFPLAWDHFAAGVDRFFVSSDEVYRIFVKTSSGKMLDLSVYPSLTIGKLKKMVQDKEGIAPSASFMPDIKWKGLTVNDCRI